MDPRSRAVPARPAARPGLGRHPLSCSQPTSCRWRRWSTASSSCPRSHVPSPLDPVPVGARRLTDAAAVPVRRTWRRCRALDSERLNDWAGSEQLPVTAREDGSMRLPVADDARQPAARGRRAGVSRLLRPTVRNLDIWPWKENADDLVGRTHRRGCSSCANGRVKPRWRVMLKSGWPSHPAVRRTNDRSTERPRATPPGSPPLLTTSSSASDAGDQAHRRPHPVSDVDRAATGPAATLALLQATALQPGDRRRQAAAGGLGHSVLPGRGRLPAAILMTIAGGSR